MHKAGATKQIKNNNNNKKKPKKSDKIANIVRCLVCGRDRKKWKKCDYYKVNTALLLSKKFAVDARPTNRIRGRRKAWFWVGYAAATATADLYCFVSFCVSIMCVGGVVVCAVPAPRGYNYMCYVRNKNSVWHMRQCVFVFFSFPVSFGEATRQNIERRILMFPQSLNFLIFQSARVCVRVGERARRINSCTVAMRMRVYFRHAFNATHAESVVCRTRVFFFKFSACVCHALR